MADLKEWGRRIWTFFSVQVVSLVVHCTTRLTVTGTDRIPRTGGVLLAANHVSMLDPLLLAWTVLGKFPLQRFYGPAKEELFRIPVLAPLLRSYGIFPVKRDGRDLPAMRKLAQLLRTNRVMIFPEGTRSPTGELGKGNRVVGRLVYESKPVVIPVAMTGTRAILPRGKTWPRLFRKVSLSFGAPVNLDSCYRLPPGRETYEEITRRIMEAIGRELGKGPVASGARERTIPQKVETR